MSPISNASKLAEFGSGIGTDGAVLQVDNTNKRIGIGTTNPQSMLQVGTGVSVYGNVGIVSATEVRADTLRGDGSNITGVVGVGTLNVRTETVTTSGVSTFAGVTKVTDTTDSTSTTTGALLVSGGVGIAKSLHVGQNITIGGTLTYEDVTNIDSLGIVTARAGVNVSGGQFLVGSGVTIGNAGVATFSGTGDVHLLDNVQLNVGDGSDLVIKHDGSNSYITDSGSGGLFIQGSGGGAGITLEDPDGNNFLVCIDEGTGGTVELYKAGNKKLETTTTGATISGEATADGLIVGSGITFGSAGVATFSGTSDIHLLDNIEAKFGDAGDFIIKHNGSDVILRNVTGTGNIRLEPKNGELGLISQPDAETSLYYNNSKKIQTTNDGSVTTGIATATGLRSSGSATVAYIEARSTSTQSTNTNKALRIRNNSDTDTFNISYKGSVGVGTDSPNFGSFGSSTSGIEISDVDTNNGLLVQSGTNEFYFANTSSSNYIWGEASAAIQVATDSTVRLNITAGGDIEFSGVTAGVASCTWDKSANSLIFKDNSEARYGDGGDLRVWHDGANSHIVNNTGYLNIQAKDGENSVFCQADGEVNIYWNGSQKLATQQYGVDVQDALFIKGAEGTSATLHLYADEADDNADNWRIVNDTSNNKLYFQNYTTGAFTTTLLLNPNGAVEDSKGDVRQIIYQNKTSGYTLVAADAGKAIHISTGGVTINNSLFSAGDAVTIINNSGSTQTITQGSGVTLYDTGDDGSTGNKTLKARGMATVWFSSASVGYITGNFD